MGRPPKPIEIHKLTGTFRHDRHGSRAGGLVTLGKPRCPPGVKSDPVAFSAWRLIVRGMPRGVLGSADTLLLAGAAKWYSLWHRHVEALAAGEGDDYKHTLLAATAWKQFTACASRLGLSPTERTRLRVNPPKVPEGPAAKFFEAKVVG